MKINKLAASTLLLAGVGISGLALAGNINHTTGYFSSMHMDGHTVNQPGQQPPATDITIADGNGGNMIAIVPNTPIDDSLQNFRPDDVDHIYNNNYGGTTHLVLENANGTPFFNQWVWRHAVIDVSEINGHLVATQITMG